MIRVCADLAVDFKRCCMLSAEFDGSGTITSDNRKAAVSNMAPRFVQPSPDVALQQSSHTLKDMHYA